MESVSQKRCSKCGAWKSFAEFGKDRRAKSGYDSRCLKCICEKNRKWQASNLDKHRESNQRYRKNHLVPSERKRKYPKECTPNEKKRLYRSENVEKLRDALRRWRASNVQKKHEQDKRHRSKYPEKTTEHNHNRRARKKSFAGSFTAKEWRDLKEYYGFTCLCCGRKEPEIKLSPDHVLPLAKGGTNTIDNIQPLCLTDNLKKGSKYIDYR